MKIVLTGSTGYIGRNILKNPSDKIEIIYALRRNKKHSFFRKFSSSKIKFIDIIELKEVLVSESIDAVVHLATFYGDDGKDNEAEINRSNVEFPSKLLELSIQNKIGYFINADSFFAKPCYDLGYKSLYTNSKRRFEEILKSKSNEINIANLRLEHVYGSKDNPQKFVGWLTNQFKDRLIKEINLSECSQERDFVYIDDVVSAFMSTIEHKDKLKGYVEFQIGTGKTTSVKQFVSKIDKEFYKYKKSKKINFLSALNRSGEIPYSKADLKNNSLINWKAKFGLNKGIEDLVSKEMN
tara:strand:- start:2192 stop:3079 length:888 start_codon:yes stop_codon:yes gene_type:complete